MIESLQNIQKEIEYVIDGMSRNHPLREHLVIANTKLGEIKNHFIDNEVQNDYEHRGF